MALTHKIVNITREQRAALKRIYRRNPEANNGLSYRDWRQLTQPTFGMDGAIAQPWAGMWLAIERDGYTHS